MRNNPAEKACHNCRRRRLKCDRTLQSCHKCARTGQECLGYGKLFLWNNGVASRGKMMGKSYAAPASQTHGKVIPNTGYPALSVHPPLLDPLLQSLDKPSRGYLYHFALNLSDDMVISDPSDWNPFRSLIPLSREHPILLHAIVANAAVHVSCLHHQTIAAPATGYHIGSLCASTYHADPSSRAMVDALSAKHKALVLLRHALSDVSNIDVDLVVTVIHLFITFDLIGPSEDEWRAHVQGAIRLITGLKSLETHQTSPVALIRDRITSDCLVYYVLGCTLMGSNHLSDPFLFPGDIVAALIRAEANSWLSLPTPLLQILFKACELSNLASTMTGSTKDASAITYASTLLQAAQTFDINAWAESLEGTRSRTQSRIHAAVSHQNAVRIYICRSIDQISSLDDDPEKLVANIISHLSHVGVTDPVFKATCWPTFISGVETNNLVYRQWALDRLHTFWNIFHWGYLKIAIEVMQTTWSLRDACGYNATGEGNWIRQLKGLKRYPLIA
ncbi:fungal-specific transcription factor domain-containing protein [Aspergillus cavernicola]|uniref:Fungal-specific transcription factor domain-containing protein n=1 Tax=Aspergillus cavernicola TaxID=176166 RepID=A0ABR4HKI7_9EURO